MGMWIIGAFFAIALVVGVWQMQQRKSKWREVAEKLGGTCVENALMAQVVIPLQPWTVTLDTFTSMSKSHTPGSKTYTRLRLPFVALEEFNFVLMRRNASTQLLLKTLQSPLGQVATAGDSKAQEQVRLLSLEEITTGDNTFDQKFILKSAQGARAKQLFEQLGNRLSHLNDFELFLQPCKGAPVASKTMVLYYQQKGIVTDVLHLKEVSELLREIAFELQHSGIASDRKPPVPTPLGL
jgi:hypothetical protein